MRVYWYKLVRVGIPLLCSLGAGVGEDARSGFETRPNGFAIHGRRFWIHSGELHCARVPREYRSHRLLMLRALGLNTVSTYVFWNLHEPQPGRFDFSGDADVAEFCRAAQRVGLYVLLRPGPYVCAEWDMGGLPWWLLKESEMWPRTRSPGNIEPARRYLKALGEQLAPLQVTRGGPILMVQVENEYLGFGRDRQYLEALAATLREAGFEVPLFTSEMSGTLGRSMSPELLMAVGFSGDPATLIAALRQVQPDKPLFCSEYYAGWFDAWGRPHHRSDGWTVQLDGLRKMLDRPHQTTRWPWRPTAARGSARLRAGPCGRHQDWHAGSAAPPDHSGAPRSRDGIDAGRARRGVRPDQLRRRHSGSQRAHGPG